MNKTMLSSMYRYIFIIEYNVLNFFGNLLLKRKIFDIFYILIVFNQYFFASVSFYKCHAPSRKN